jgi:hypothetical protein
MNKIRAGIYIKREAIAPFFDPRRNEANKGKVKYQTYAEFFTPPVRKA